MREVCLMVGMLMLSASGYCHASDGGAMTGQELLYNFKLLIGIGLFGVVGSALLSLFGNAKIANLIQKVSYLAGFVVFLGIATTLLDRFATIYQKIEKIIG